MPGPRPLPRLLLLLMVAVTGIALMAGTTGCTPDDEPVREVHAVDVWGLWESDRGGSLRFREDGTFIAADLLGEALWATWKGRRLGGAGSWAVERDVHRKDDPPTTVTLDFGPQAEDPSRYSTRLYSEGTGSSLVLYLFIDDPDLNDTYRFHRAASPESSGRL
jgi:hypothetical protein